MGDREITDTGEEDMSRIIQLLLCVRFLAFAFPSHQAKLRHRPDVLSQRQRRTCAPSAPYWGWPAKFWSAVPRPTSARTSAGYGAPGPVT